MITSHIRLVRIPFESTLLMKQSRRNATEKNFIKSNSNMQFHAPSKSERCRHARIRLFRDQDLDKNVSLDSQQKCAHKKQPSLNKKKKKKMLSQQNTFHGQLFSVINTIWIENRYDNFVPSPTSWLI